MSKLWNSAINVALQPARCCSKPVRVDTAEEKQHVGLVGGRHAARALDAD